MSDLAPLFAAAPILRDKALSDLQEENARLRRKLSLCRSVEVTGPGGTPVYARARFDEDGRYHDNPNLWHVVFRSNDDENIDTTSCPLADLEAIEIRLGGAVRADAGGSFSNALELFFDDDVVDLDENNGNDDDDKRKILSLCFQPGSVWLGVDVGFSVREWRDVASSRGTTTTGDASFFSLEHLCRDVANVHPERRVVFRDAAFCVRHVDGTIPASADRDERAAAEREERRRFQRSIELVVTRLRWSGNADSQPDLLGKALEIYKAWRSAGGEDVDDEDNDDEFVEHVDRYYEQRWGDE